METDEQKHVIFRSPTSHDARAMRGLARDSQVLSVNSTYYYALMASHFRETCLVAECNSQICGYITGYCPPGQPETLFVWQVGVARAFQGQGVGKKMLIALLNAKQPKFLEATIGPENQASISLFQAVARYYNVDHRFSQTPFFAEEDLGDGDQAEYLMRVGPFGL